MKKLILFFLLIGSISNANTIRIGIIGDLNSTECQTKYPSNSITAYKNLRAAGPLDQLIMTGDVVHGECLKYSGSKPYADVVRAMWSEFENVFVKPLLTDFSLIPIVAAGNHDAPFVTSKSRTTFKEENLGFKNYWLGVNPLVDRIQVSGASDNYPYYWAFENNQILFLVIQSTTTGSLSDGVKQKLWLKEVLNSNIAKTAIKRIAYGHIPAYPVLDKSVGSKYSEIIDAEQVGKTNGLIDLFLDSNVDLFVTGHSHAPYPAELTRNKDGKKLTILSMPCSHAPRKLYSKSALAPRGFAFVEIDNLLNINISIKNWSDGISLKYDYFPKSIPVGGTTAKYSLIPKGNYLE